MNKTNLMADKIVVKGFSKLLAPRSYLPALRSSLLAFLFLFIAGQVEAQYISETMTLKQGWNAIYLESTPDDASCEAFFADVPAVTTVLAYRGDAYSSTRQYADDGSVILQKPVSYLTWNRGDTTGSTLGFLAGGRFPPENRICVHTLELHIFRQRAAAQQQTQRQQCAESRFLFHMAKSPQSAE